MKTSELPILDCSKIAGPYEGIEETEGFKEFTRALCEGMRGIGFVYLVNHGVTPDTIEAALETSRGFFELPKTTKEKYRKVDAVEYFHGYTPAEDEVVNENSKSAPDYKEAWDCWGLEMDKECSYPKEAPQLRPAMNDFRESLVTLSNKLFLAFSIHLGLEDPEFLRKKHRAIEDLTVRSQNVVRSNYYMPLREEQIAGIKEDSMRLTEHNDWGTVTFLIQDHVGGLEAKKPNGDWIKVPPIKDSIVLNAGLMLEMWSGGHFPATFHRVRLLKEAANTVRQSIGYFIQPDGDAHCVPLVPEKEDWTPLYPKVDKKTHFEYFKDRVRGSRAY